MLPNRAFVLGGAASGKSAYAENLTYLYGKSRVYLATAQIFDDEMAAKKNRHLAQRGDDWTTIEEPFDAATVLKQAGPDQVYLMDCATLWLTNHMLAEHDLDAEQDRLMRAMNTCKANLVVVSNEVGQGIVPDTTLGRRFREAQGRLNIDLAKNCDLVVQIVAGLPNVLKGRLP
ncbi:MAG: bifunctional adenosylcobinamide kinase/adenosylcobinamide-phosphate guanylyltransferase [Rhodobacteraceae bacterium]|nr:bifunctional adenosylcobinamide kinase/adenosylcobinamide-phosphate guanylyltransferase [Paracoccaceae bacterium]